ncbi:dienelactone hydrolase family protein [Thalassospira lucentensis]|uniref:dienelactone hydrolase family protein n=1 Tax=Thalassospira lucentensis TaxID=168935 RepID=UPI00294223A8|nr:dienelactone hydrolase family protein [Thalassospira lucentensis]WOI08976.1 dienelactone hydrolase family protein [Thalassospira lucentensis]
MNIQAHRLGGVFILLTMLLGCATPASRTALRDTLIQKAGWKTELLSAGAFDVFSVRTTSRNGAVLTVYLEGDGYAYMTPNRISPDPTPINPLALRLAIADPGTGPVAYLARACQYVMPDHGRNCARPYWSFKRYAPEIVDNANLAIDALKQRTSTTKIMLVGYSGGGALAVLVAAHRDDVAGIVTVASNLDLGYWTRRDDLMPLEGSLDPVDFSDRVAIIPQVHFSGALDTTVGPDVTRAYMSLLPQDAPARMITKPTFDHSCCWAVSWPELFKSTGLQTFRD